MSKTMMQKTGRNKQRGFALILVLGILTVAAIILGTVLAQQDNQTTWAPVTGTKERLDEVQHALAAYQRNKHRLPIPAARVSEGGTLRLHTELTSALNTAYQLPSTVTDLLRAGQASVSLPGGLVVASSDPLNAQDVILIGAVPTESLGLPREAAEDKNGNLLTYAVSVNMLSPFTYDTATGAIDLKDPAGGVVASDLAYVVLSHGKDAKGTWSAKNRFQGRSCAGGMTPSGGQPGSGGQGTAGSDYANCAHEDANFVISDLTMVRGSGGFDDQLARGERDSIATAQTRPCIGPIDVTWSDALCPSCNCIATIPAPGLVSQGTGTPDTADLEDTTPADVGEAKVECIDGVATVVAGTNTCTRPCNLPWGGTLQNGDSVASYSVASVACGESCPAAVMRTCVNGNLTAGGDFPSCIVGACTPTGCSLPWGGTIADGASVQAYAVAAVPCGDACPAPVTRTCTAGVLSGSGDFANCYVESCTPTDCTLPWGGTLADGQSVQAYSTDSVTCGNSCPSPTTRTCNAGVLSGSGDHENCEVAECGSCSLPWGGTIADGDSVQAYSTDSVACGESCPAPITRTCSNGTLSGSGDHAACTVETCAASCTLPWGGTIPEGESVEAYSIRYVRTCAGACPAPEIRVCNDGVLSGSAQWRNCAEEPECMPCSLPWGGGLPSGQTVVAYAAATVGCGQACTPQPLTCTDGTLSGSGTSPTCSQSCSCSAWVRECEPIITTTLEPNCASSGGEGEMRNCRIESNGGTPSVLLCGGESRCDFRCCQ